MPISNKIPKDSLRTKLTLGLLACASLSACTNIGRSYDQINPEAAAADVKANNGYSALNSVTPDTAKIVLHSDGKGSPGTIVAFSIGPADEPCSSLSTIGTVADTGHGRLLPGIAKMLGGMSRMSGAKPFLVNERVADRPLQIRGYASSTRESTQQYGTTTTTTLYYKTSCGPITSKFIPLPNHAYWVKFTRDSEKSCSQQVMDATDRDAPVPVPTEVVASCPMPK